MSKSVELLKDIVSLKPNGEVREQQETAVQEIESAINTDTNLLLEAPTGSGKALAIDTPILTNSGWKSMGSLTVEDKVYDENGQLTDIVKVLDVFQSEKTYEITFSNGNKITTDSDHLWRVKPYSEKPAATQELEDTALEEVSGKLIFAKQTGKDEILDVHALADSISYPAEVVNHAAAELLSEALENTPEKLIFDGTMLLEAMYKHYLGRVATHTTEELFGLLQQGSRWSIELPEALQTGEDIRPAVPARLLGQWLATGEPLFNEAQYDALHELGLKDNAHIPAVALTYPVKHRQELLLGLLNGSTTGKFQTTISTLAYDIQTLASSLGLFASVSLVKSGEKAFYNVHVDIQDTVDIINIVSVESRAVRCITVASESHLYLAGKALIPTHNTLSYLIPLVETGAKAVVSTATKQLSEQIFDSDIPFVKKALRQLKSGAKLDAALLKGRDNYLCLAKLDKALGLENEATSLFGNDDLMDFAAENGYSKSSGITNGKAAIQETKAILEWANETDTGDRSHAPAVSDETWRQYSVTNAECPGRNACPFGEECFAEQARAKAKTANVIVTNHAIAAQDLAGEGNLLGDRDVFVFDELHELDNYLSSAWGAELSSKKLRDAYKIFRPQSALNPDAVNDINLCAEDLPKVLHSMESGLIDNEDTPRTLGTLLSKLYNAATRISTDAAKALKNEDSDGAKRLLTAAKKNADELLQIAEVLNDSSIETVRWVIDKNAQTWKPAIQKKSKLRKPQAPKVELSYEDERTLHAAPLRIGPKLQSYLDDREAIMIGTSATITIGRKFDIPLHNFGLDKKKHKAVELDSPFDYKKQAMFYVPKAGSFPEPTGADRAEHTAAVRKTIPRFVKAAGGRSLVLSTTSGGAEGIAEAIRATKPNFEVIAQGEAPNAQLVKQFREEETTSLIGTMGFWHGLDAPGKTLSFVAIDKLPFMRFDDPLAMARRNYADRMGRNGFMDVFVSYAETMFRQAFGRGVRSKSDLVVIAAFDVRLRTKSYGLGILNNLHGVGVYSDEQKVLEALRRLAAK